MTFNQNHVKLMIINGLCPKQNGYSMIPILTALACLFLAAFVFELATVHADYFIPARVLTRLGAICFTLFSIVSILESGTSSR